MAEVVALSAVVVTILVMVAVFLREVKREREVFREGEVELSGLGPIGSTLPPGFEHTEEQGMCPVCNARDRTCQVCEGKGSILYYDDSYDEPIIHLGDGDDCPSCEGEGFRSSIREDRTLDPCEFCWGTGVVDTRELLKQLGFEA